MYPMYRWCGPASFLSQSAAVGRAAGKRKSGSFLEPDTAAIQGGAFVQVADELFRAGLVAEDDDVTQTLDLATNRLGDEL